MEFPARQLVWLQDGDNLLHPGECGKGQLLQYPLIPDGAENRTLFSSGDMDGESKVFQTLLDMPDLLFCGVRPEYDDHKISSFCPPQMRPADMPDNNTLPQHRIKYGLPIVTRLKIYKVCLGREIGYPHGLKLFIEEPLSFLIDPAALLNMFRILQC